MEMFIVALSASALTAIVTAIVMTRRARSEQERLQRRLDELTERMQRAGAALAAADVQVFEIPVGSKRVRSPLQAAEDELAAVDFLGNPAEFVRQVHPDDVAQLEDELRTLTLQDGTRCFGYRLARRDGRNLDVRVVTRLVRDALGRPALVSGTMLTKSAAAFASEDTQSQSSPEPVAEPDTSVEEVEWQSYLSDHTASNVVDGEFTQVESRRVQRAR